jgi:hypothetical protein
VPFEIERNHARRLLVVRATGVMSPSEVVAFIRKERAGEYRRYRLLFDATGATMRARPADLELWVTAVKEVVAREGPRAPVALVGTTESLLSFVEAYAQRCQELGVATIRVFRGVDAARAWLETV